MKRNKIVNKVLAGALAVAMLFGLVGPMKKAQADAATETQKTGALELVHPDYPRKEEVWFKTTGLNISISTATTMTAKEGMAGMLHNGVAFSGGSVELRLGADVGSTTNGLRWGIPSITTLNLQVGDELKLFGEFTYNDGESSVWITPTVIRCVALHENGTHAYWELVSSEEETEEMQNGKNFLTLSDFNSANAYTYTGGDSLLGTTFFINLSYALGQRDDPNTHMYYGSSGSYTGIGIVLEPKTGGADMVVLDRRSSNAYNEATVLYREFMSHAQLIQKNLIRIDLSEADDNDIAILSVAINEKQVVQNKTITNASFFGNKLKFIQGKTYVLAGTSYTYEEYLMDEVPEITAADFGLEDRIYSGTDFSGTSYELIRKSNSPIDGKKLVFELADVDASSYLAFAYGDFQLFFAPKSHNEPWIQVHTLCRSTSFQTEYYVSSPFKIEIYTEYVDNDGDGISDDMRALLRVNGDMVSLGAKACTCGCGSEATGYWLYTKDKLYSETAKIRFYMPFTGQSITSYKLTSLNTHTAAVLKDGVLTISGRGTVLPSLLNGVVTDAKAVTDIIIEDGITAVESSVFQGYENLKTVTYGKDVETVSATAFVDCNTGVEVKCPPGKDFFGGLEDAIQVKVVANVAVPQTGIVNPAVVVTRVDSQASYNSLSGSAVAILDIDENLNIMFAEDSSQSVTVDDYMAKYKHTVIPAFRIDSEAEKNAICAYLEEKQIIDAFYVVSSENVTLLKQARETYGFARGIIEYDSMPEDSNARVAIRRQMHENLAFVGIFPERVLTADITAEFNIRGLSVWSDVQNEGDVYAGISGGVNGLIASAPNTIIDVYKGITVRTLSGKPMAIAHRGQAGALDYPENTITAYKAMVEEYGAAACEMDLNITKDETVILLTDATLDRTTDGEGAVIEKTLDEVKQLTVDIARSGKTDKIPTLEEVFEAFKGTDTVLYLHLNVISGYKSIMEQLPELVRKHSMEDNVVILDRGRHYQNPTYLAYTGGDSEFIQGADEYYAIENLIKDLGPDNEQMLPSIDSNIGEKDSLAYAMSARGMLTLNSTTDSEADLDKYFITERGNTALFTNFSNQISEYYYQIEAKNTTWVVGETINLTQKVNKIVGDTTVNCGVIQVGGNTVVVNSDGSTSGSAGSVEVVYYADITLARGYGNLTYRIYSAPVTITLVEASRLGDLDLDGKHTVVDLVKLMKALLETKVSVGLCDVNKDGVVDKNDISYMREVLVGKSQIGN